MEETIGLVQSVVVDTSVWIEYFRTTSEVSDLLKSLIRENRAVVVGPVLIELLQGTKSQKEYQAVLNVLSGLPYLDSPWGLWVAAGQLSASLRKQGITLPAMDVLIAISAMENRCAVLTFDAHFEAIPGLTRYPLPASPGPASPG
jgi:predicted nucleic acid-binding protein